MTFRLHGHLRHDTYRRTLPRPQSVVLFVLLLATIVMPVKYRAGADHTHAHTIFQGLIDAIAGHPHHHGDETTPKPVSPFASAAIPLSIQGGHQVEQGLTHTVNQETDAPTLLGLSMPITASAPIQALGLLVAALLAGTGANPLWYEAHRLEARTVGVDIPPPRFD